MPPKKKGKGGGKKKGKGKKGKDDAALEVEEQYKKTQQEIVALKDHLAFRRELTLTSQSAASDMRNKMEETMEKLHTQEIDTKAISADMTRQYKTKLTQMGLLIDELRYELDQTRKKLELTELELKNTRQERDRIIQEKNDQIDELNRKIDDMGKSFESILMDTMDDLTLKIQGSREKWENEATLIQTKNKQTLLEFGLNPLDL